VTAPAASRPRVGFAGTPEFAASILAALVAGGYEIPVVYTQPDRKAGRGRRLVASAVKQLALAEKLTIAQPQSLRTTQAAAELATYGLDVLVVAAYGLILPQSILDTPRLGCINVHASLLPRWRGAAPVERAIMAGDRETGVSIMQMDAGLDTGPVYAARACPISDRAQGPELEAHLARIGANLLLECLQDLEERTPRAQTEVGACYAAKLTKTDAVVDWNQDAAVIDRQIRALCGRIPATVNLGKLQIKLLQADTLDCTSQPKDPGTIVRSDRRGIVVACNPGCLSLQRLQLNVGKGSVLDAAAARNGYPDIFAEGAQLVGP